jgi:hypothetical protein
MLEAEVIGERNANGRFERYSCYYVCVLTTLYVCPRLKMCLHTTIYVSSYFCVSSTKNVCLHQGYESTQAPSTSR